MKKHHKPPRDCQGPVRGWTHKGLGRVYMEQKEVELFGVYPGEEVSLWVGRGRNAWLQNILKPQAARVEARCPHFGMCGGCGLQPLTYVAQVQLKSAPVIRALARLEPECEILPPFPSAQQFYYRSKVEFSFLGDTLGFHQRGRFDRLVEVRECLIGPPGNRELLAATRAWSAAQGLIGWDVRAHTGQLRYLVVRRSASTGQWLAVLVTSPGVTREQAQLWADQVQGLGPTGLIWGRQTSSASAVVVEEETLLYGEPQIEEMLAGLRYQLQWRSFFQSNPPAYASMLETARSWIRIDPGEKLLDLFCGIGTIGLTLTPPDCRLVGVENVPEAIEDARRCAQDNTRLAEFHCMAAQDWTDLDCRLLVLDPPRSGCHPKLIERVAAQGPAQLLYISCNPARFVEEYAQLGVHYRLVRSQLFDFFPQTRHIEALCLLERR